MKLYISGTRYLSTQTLSLHTHRRDTIAMNRRNVEQLDAQLYERLCGEFDPVYYSAGTYMKAGGRNVFDGILECQTSNIRKMP